MCARSKALSLVMFLALLLALLVLTTGPGQAVPKTVSQCQTDVVYCLDKCGAKVVKCEKEVGVGCESLRILCKDNCTTAEKDCIKDAGKGAAKVPFKPKVQPKFKPGGAETPGTESPNVQPEGGIERY